MTVYLNYRLLRVLNNVTKKLIFCKTPIINASRDNKVGQELPGIFPDSCYFDLSAFPF